MPNSPHRPFVPKRTPPEKRATAESEFRISPPFVHGPARVEPRNSGPIEQPKPVPSIADFLAMDRVVPADRPAPIADLPAREAPRPPTEVAVAEAPAWAGPPSIADFAAAETPFDYGSTGAGNNEYELPPIEHFTDTIVEEGTPAGAEYEFAPDDPFAELPLPSTSDE
ncbi:MAG TPA: hypothetical protein VJZ25_05260, partial [Gemmatimonadaceae bacterium]|nr:hypothetical protein [Gemmatimonadaceae bacterium]